MLKEVSKMINELILKNRSYRRFVQSHTIEISTLKKLVNLARFSASANNMQPLKYLLSADLKTNNLIFPQLGWAGSLPDWPGPAEGERPSAFIIILGDKNISSNFYCDHGIAAQSILLGAVELELGGCMMGTIKRAALQEALNIPANIEILLVLTLGKPAEEIILEELKPDGDTKYWRDENGGHHVPKRSLEDIIIF